MGRDTYPKQSLGSLHTTIKASKVLMVGAGGIGCELLKNLVLTGFGEIHIIDLDTIDLSNLNRQFLFRHEHIKKSKALVAKETAGKFNPNVKIEAYHGNIKDAQFNVDWFAQFTLVFNALDNLDARRHVNRMCLAADVPLIESGTTGFNGQVQVIRKGKTECYDCNPKEVPKSFPVCTIRSTPSQPIHCIVWAKSYLLPELFGTSEDESADVDSTEDAENAEEIENLKQEAQALKAIRDSMGQDDFAKKVFDKVFKDDIERLRNMEGMWKTRAAPIALSYEDLEERAKPVEATISVKDQQTWTTPENFAVFQDSLKRLTERYQNEKGADGKPEPITFDKDDVDTLDFVAATANLRSVVFNIATKSKFDIKQMAGNIIPAIATTNAMTAGLCVLQAFKVLRNDLARAKTVFLERSGARAINSESLRPPNPYCPVCSVCHVRTTIDMERATLGDLVEIVLRAGLGYDEEFTINSDIGTIYDPDMEENLPKKLTELGVKPETFLTVIDDEDEPRQNLQIIFTNTTIDPSEPAISLPSKPEILKKPPPPPPSEKDEDEAPAESIPSTSNGTKRKRPADDAEITMVDDESPPQKRKTGSIVVPQMENGATATNGSANGVNGKGKNGVVEVADDGFDGAIVLD